MKNNKTWQVGAPAGAPPRGHPKPAHRILVVEDDEVIRNLNAEVLADSGYQVDAAEDGAAAWETLQRRRYDLMVTDNDMPKVSGLELLQRLHAAHMDLPVIMATGSLPMETFTHWPWLQPAALLLKPYSFKELLGTVQVVLRAAVLMAMVLVGLPAAVHAQEPLLPPSGLRLVSSTGAARPKTLVFAGDGNMVINVQQVKPAPDSRLQSPDSPAQPIAMTVSVLGTCQYSADGVTFTPLAKGQILEQGATIRAGEDAHTDLFFRRTGTTVRLQAGTEMRIEKMTLTIKDGLPVVNTLLDLRKGRIFTVVRSTVAGSTLEIRNAAGRSVVEGSGVGRYIITADGTHVAAEGSAIPLKLIRENGITLIAAGQQFDPKDGKVLAASPPLWVKDMIQLDELQAVTEQPAATPPPKP